MEPTFSQRLRRRYLRNLGWLRPFVSLETHCPATGRQLFQPEEWEIPLGELWARRAQAHHP
jgi:hypothetical protein